MAKAQGNKVTLDGFLGLVIGGSAAFGLLVLTRRAWDECRVQINDVGNGLTLLFVGLPVAAVTNIVLFSLVFRYSRSGKRGRFVMPLITALVAITILDLALFSWAGTPASAPVSVCPANVPSWWPEWIPT